MLAKLRELDWEPGKGNPVEYVDEYGDTLLHSAARNGEADVIKVLLEMGADANVCCQGECCCSPLMVASRWYHPECVSLLLRHGADTSYVNNRGETALVHVRVFPGRCVGLTDGCYQSSQMDATNHLSCP